MIRAGEERAAAKAALCLILIRAREEIAERGLEGNDALEHEAETVLSAFERGIQATARA